MGKFVTEGIHQLFIFIEEKFVEPNFKKIGLEVAKGLRSFKNDEMQRIAYIFDFKTVLERFDFHLVAQDLKAEPFCPI